MTCADHDRAYKDLARHPAVSRRRNSSLLSIAARSSTRPHTHTPKQGQASSKAKLLVATRPHAHAQHPVRPFHPDRPSINPSFNHQSTCPSPVVCILASNYPPTRPCAALLGARPRMIHIWGARALAASPSLLW